MKAGSMWNEDDILMLSQLTHGGYCLRRAALVMNEGLWGDSADTVKGHIAHERVHTRRMERRGSHVRLYDYEVHSEELGLYGKCDCIEGTESESGCVVPNIPFPVQLRPVEYKHGKARKEEEYEIQLCAQAMCLEEMFDTQIPEGDLFYTSSHRRYPVELTKELRQKVLEIIQQIRAVKREFRLPKADYGPKCKRCSLKDICMPRLRRSASDYCTKLAKEVMEEVID
jgi:CRISPR-associated exonuclease Cas4